MGIFDRIVNYFYPPAPPVGQTSPAQKNDGGGDPVFDGLVATVKAGKIPKDHITQEQATPYLTKMYAAKKEYEKVHPEPPINPSTLTNEQQLAVLDAEPLITDVYNKGIEYGKMLAATTGGQDVLVAENHNQTAQWDAMVGIVAGLKAAGNTRPIIVVREQSRCASDNYVELGIEEWNAQNPQDHQGQLGLYNAHLSGWHNIKEDALDSLSDAQKNPSFYTHVPSNYALNAISLLVPEVKYFPIDLNHFEMGREYSTRDAAMAMTWQAIRKVYPDAIIIGNFGANHALEQKEDDHEIADKRKYGGDCNDPLAEQLTYSWVGIGEHDAADRVHTIRIRPTKAYLHDDAYNQPVYTNNGAFDEVWHVAPQPQGPNSTWDPNDHVWAKG